MPRHEDDEPSDTRTVRMIQKIRRSQEQAEEYGDSESRHKSAKNTEKKATLNKRVRKLVENNLVPRITGYDDAAQEIKLTIEAGKMKIGSVSTLFQMAGMSFKDEYYSGSMEAGWNVSIRLPSFVMLADTAGLNPAALVPAIPQDKIDAARNGAVYLSALLDKKLADIPEDSREKAEIYLREGYSLVPESKEKFDALTSVERKHITACVANEYEESRQHTLRGIIDLFVNKTGEERESVMKASVRSSNYRG